MKSIHELALKIQELEDQVIVCMRCGMCQSVCPLFAETGRESDVARGKLALLDGLMQEMLETPESAGKRLERCLLCGSCAANCPSGVKVLDIFFQARAVLTAYTGLSAAKKVILRNILARPKLLDMLTEWAARFQYIFTRPANEIIGTSCARFGSALIDDRNFRPLAAVPFHRLVPSLDTEGKSGMKVAFYVGCLMDKVFPNVAQATVDVLTHHQTGIFMPDNQGCCGIPALSSGDTQTFNRLLAHNLNRFESRSFDYLITACATCTSTIKKLWPLMAESEDLKARARKIAEKSIDINQFLVSQMGIKPAQSDNANQITVTYHDPCHLKKSLGVSAEPRTLIQAHPGYRVKEMAEPDQCCGMGGSFNLQYYELSGNIGKRKRDQIVATGCSTVATGCPACMIQLSDMLSKAGDRIAVRHPIEIYAEYLKNP
jgi:glycolate oxidase iron-sulfur subunit